MDCSNILKAFTNCCPLISSHGLSWVNANKLKRLHRYFPGFFSLDNMKARKGEREREREREREKESEREK